MSAQDSSATRSTKKGGNGHRWSLLAALRNRFLAGLAVAIPLIVSIWILILTYQFILTVGKPVIAFVFHLIELEPPDWVINLFGIVAPIVLLVALGFMATNVIGKRIIAVVDRVLSRFPMVSFIYTGLKQVIDSFKGFGAGRSFKRVVYVEYPAPGCRLIAFVTGQYFDHQLNTSVTSVFIPTSPNPMTGFVVVVDSDKLMDAALTIEEATKVILSAGLVSPEDSHMPHRELVASLAKNPGSLNSPGASPKKRKAAQASGGKKEDNTGPEEKKKTSPEWADTL